MAKVTKTETEALKDRAAVAPGPFRNAVKVERESSRFSLAAIAPPAIATKRTRCCSISADPETPELNRRKAISKSGRAIITPKAIEISQFSVEAQTAWLFVAHPKFTDWLF
jgi:hypothetical protein